MFRSSTSFPRLIRSPLQQNTAVYIADRIHTLTIDIGECSAWRSDRYNPGEKSPDDGCITEPNRLCDDDPRKRSGTSKHRKWSKSLV